jgi:hypothetical protein
MKQDISHGKTCIDLGSHPSPVTTTKKKQDISNSKTCIVMYSNTFTLNSLLTLLQVKHLKASHNLLYIEKPTISYKNLFIAKCDYSCVIMLYILN